LSTETTILAGAFIYLLTMLVIGITVAQMALQKECMKDE
jgi:hypothetical protein